MQAKYFIIALLMITLVAGSSCKQGGSSDDNKNIVTLTTENFDQEISKGVVLVDFWATWCMPCKAMAPVINEIASQTQGKIKVGKVDVDANGEIANRYGIQAIPTFIIFNEGKQVENLIGMQSKESLVQALEKYIKLQ